MRIINVEVDAPTIFNLFLILQYGRNRILLIYLTPREDVRSYLSKRFNFDLKFQPYDHVKVEVTSGQITVAGEVVNSPQLKRGIRQTYNGYPLNCPFGKSEWDDKARLGN